MKSIIVLLTIAAIGACSNRKDCEMPTQIPGTGEIVSTARVSQPLTTWEMRDNEHVICTDSQNVFNLTVSFDNGINYDSIDFNEYTLLGKYARGSCNVTYERSVVKNDTDKKYLYSIRVHQCGKCETNWESMNWVLIPKIPEDYSVVFVVDYVSLL